MATWDSVKTYVISNYKTSELDGGELKIIFELADLRSQVVIVDWAGPSESEASWVDFHSPIGTLEEVDLRRAVELSSRYVGGAISTIAGLATVRISVPLTNLDRNEIDDPMRVACLSADALEKELTGKDTY